jgi:simple sugar transport system permease protein
LAPVFVSLLILQTLSSGLNLLGANQHLSTAVWGLFLIAVMVFRSSTPTLRVLFESVRK